MVSDTACLMFRIFCEPSDMGDSSEFDGDFKKVKKRIQQWWDEVLENIRIIDGSKDESDKFEGSRGISNWFGSNDLTNCVLDFKPLYLPWVEKEQGTRVSNSSDSIVLPCGVGPGSFSIRVIDGGEYLENSSGHLPLRISAICTRNGFEQILQMALKSTTQNTWVSNIHSNS